MTRLGIIMDPIGSINPKKDSSLAMLIEAQKRNWEIYYMEASDLYLDNHQVHAEMRPLHVNTDIHHWYDYGDSENRLLSELDVILMRKDPPFDMEYIITTYFLEQVERTGTLIVNKPQSLRDANEKLFTAWFPQCTAPSLVSSQARHIKDFLQRHGDIILKPLTEMGGASIFRVRVDDPNLNVIIEVITALGTKRVMAQQYLPAIKEGDKRILLINGEPIPYALARLAAPGETRANLAAGGSSRAIPLSDRDLWLCQQVGPTLREKGLIFVGLDVIGDYITEINVTSPTCIREIEAAFDINISAILMDAIENKLA